MGTLRIAQRFCGPPGSANGGYFAGLVAAVAKRSVTVRLLKPPPLDMDLTVTEQAEGLVEVRSGEALIAQTRLGEIDAPDLAPPSYLQAVEASRRYVGFTHHPFRTCFVCGPQRARRDGLRIFPGPLSQPGLVAAPWVADESLDGGDGKVRPEFMWAALDCPGWLASAPDAHIALLGELTAHIDRRVRLGAQCIVVGWHINTNGRKHQAGTALFDEDGELCGYARALWIEPRVGSTAGAGAA
jgi:hypothetical protein